MSNNYDTNKKAELRMPLKFIKKEDKSECVIHGRVFNLTKKDADLVPWNGQDQVLGELISTAYFAIKFSKKKNWETVKDDNEHGLTLSDEKWSIEGNEISGFMTDVVEFYKINSADPVFDSVLEVLDAQLANGDLDHLITRNDGDDWSEAEAKVILEIYLKTKDGDMADKILMIKEYINEGKLNRTQTAIRLQVDGMHFFDEDSEKHGFSNMAKVFKKVWDDSQSVK